MMLVWGEQGIQVKGRGAGDDTLQDVQFALCAGKQEILIIKRIKKIAFYMSVLTFVPVYWRLSFSLPGGDVSLG